MADNSVQIAKISKLLASGVTSMMIDGQQVQINPDSLRKELLRLQRTDDSNRSRRPVCSAINLGCQ
jgi:hypothetical protein